MQAKAMTVGMSSWQAYTFERIPREGTDAMAKTEPRVVRDVEPLRRLSHWLDELVPLPGGYRIGLDGILGLIPGAGDALGAVVSSYIITQAARLGVPTRILLLMIYNVAIDAVVGLIPILGDLFDFAWKANRRNVALLERHQGEVSYGSNGNKRLWTVLLILILLFVALIIALAYGFIQLLFALAAAG